MASGCPPSVESAPDLGGWQRLSPWALVFLFLNGLQQFIRQNLYAFLGAGAGFAFIEALGWRELGLAASGIVLTALVLTMVYHRRFRFRLEDDAVRVCRGILERSELRVRFERVQNVSLSQPFYLRPFGLVRFALETPGAAQKEVELPGISRAIAETMRVRIAEYTGPGAAAQAEESDASAAPGESPIYHASPGALFVHGVVGNEIWILLGAAAGLYGTMERRITPWLSEQQWIVAWASEVEGNPAHALMLAGGLGAVLAILLALSGVVALVRFHDYRLTREGDRFRANFGLLDTREKTLKEAKLQGIVLVQTALGRLLGRFYLLGRQTGSEIGQPHGAVDRFLVPGLGRRDVLLVAAGLQPRAGRWPEWRPIAPEFRQVFWARLTLLLLAVAAVLYFLPPVPDWIALGPVVANLLFLGLVWARWRWWAWAREGRLMWVRSGLVGQHVNVFETVRVQHVAISRNLIQRRRGLATLRLRLPHGDVMVPWIRLETARDLANRILFEVETARDHQV